MFSKLWKNILGKKPIVTNLLILALCGANAFFVPRAMEVISFGNTESLAVILYHSVREDTAHCGKYVLSKELFENDLIYLKENGYQTVSVAMLYDFVNGNITRLPEKSILLTFDDGCYNIYTYVLPLLREYGMRGVVCPVGEFTVNQNSEQKIAYSYMNIDQIRELYESGVFEIANHSYNMHGSPGRTGLVKINGESDEQFKLSVTEDLGKMQELLAGQGIECRIFAYPYGIQNDLSRQAVNSMGFICSLSCEMGINELSRGSSLMDLKRYNRPHGSSSEEFFNGIFGNR
ncbi:MAG: polysaccharide deacetylase family protein [Eubacteriaceae bacterium]|nr:polysaccharide deacetylase family protein [Eubacteriaceae bacterium]